MTSWRARGGEITLLLLNQTDSRGALSAHRALIDRGVGVIVPSTPRVVEASPAPIDHRGAGSESAGIGENTVNSPTYSKPLRRFSRNPSLGSAVNLRIYFGNIVLSIFNTQEAVLGAGIRKTEVNPCLLWFYNLPG